MATSEPKLSRAQCRSKRAFDFCLAFVGLLMVWWLILLAFAVATIDTRSNGFFIQRRVGKGGELFRLVKIKTMRPDAAIVTTVTRSNDPRITLLGTFLRNTKIDELPQLWNVLLGDMSFVGPRPDVPGYADKLTGEDRAILMLRPGITGPATLKYRNEEDLLEVQGDAERYNREVVFPDKVKINLEYIRSWSFLGDLRYIVKTIVSAVHKNGV
ncbi:MAG: sugar transferase [Gammaproteobacteria bacterium]|nr:sugar transferase [Gammaproteobacteria bacterium]